MKIINKLKNNLLLGTIILISSFLLLSFILYLINIRFRFYIIILFIIISTFLLIAGIIQFIHKINSKISLLISIIVTFLLYSLAFPIIIIIVFLTFPNEKISKVNDKKYIVVKEYHSSQVDLFYYKYITPFLMGTKVLIHGEYNMDNPGKTATFTYYDSNGLIEKIVHGSATIDDEDNLNPIIDIPIIKNPPSTSNKADLYLFPEDEEVVYETNFDNTVIRFGILDYALGQNMLVNVIKSTDGGQNFYNVTDNFIQVSLKAQFLFLNEQLGFAINNGIVGLKASDVTGMYVTNNGGKSFDRAIFKWDYSTGYIKIKELPYLIDNALYVKCDVVGYDEKSQKYEENDITFTSADNGLTWNKK